MYPFGLMSICVYVCMCVSVWFSMGLYSSDLLTNCLSICMYIWLPICLHVRLCTIRMTWVTGCL